MICLSLAAAAVAFALFALATDAHALARLHVRPTRTVCRARRIIGWLLLGLAFTVAVADRGWGRGSVTCMGTIMFAAGCVFLALNLLPHRRKA